MKPLALAACAALPLLCAASAPAAAPSPASGSAVVPIAASAPPITPFSASPPGTALPAPWRVLALPGIKAPDIALVADGGVTVLRVVSAAAAGTGAHPLRANAAAAPRLSWRWKVDRVVAKADLARRDGDDFAARVYVFFDIPPQELALGERLKLQLARWLHGGDVPAGGLCYVWDNRHAIGTIAPNPYAPAIRTVVLRSGGGEAGAWVDERRDLEADFRAAFGTLPSGVPPVTGIAAGNDTDQSGESATAWFGDFRLGPRS
jgi:hypothetical protein